MTVPLDSSKWLRLPPLIAVWLTVSPDARVVTLVLQQGVLLWEALEPLGDGAGWQKWVTGGRILKIITQPLVPARGVSVLKH